jgi:hypothetical protein
MLGIKTAIIPEWWEEEQQLRMRMKGINRKQQDSFDCRGGFEKEVVDRLS